MVDVENEMLVDFFFSEFVFNVRLQNSGSNINVHGNKVGKM